MQAQAIVIVLPGAHYVIDESDVRDGFNYLGKSSHRSVAQILVDWATPIANGCTVNTLAECQAMITLIARYLWDVCEGRVYDMVKLNLQELGREDIIEMVEAKHQEWENIAMSM